MNEQLTCLGMRLKELRRKRLLTLQQLAERTELTELARRCQERSAQAGEAAQQVKLLRETLAERLVEAGVFTENQLRTARAMISSQRLA